MRSRKVTTVIWMSLAAVLAFALLIGINLSAVAQGEVVPQTATPRPSPTGNGGKATWTIRSMTYKSNYPNGFTFDLDASSSGGKIVGGNIVWRYSPSSNSSRLIGKLDPATGKLSATADNLDLPQWAGVEYWWLLHDEAGNMLETTHKYDEYADNTRKWHRDESEDIIVFWQDGLPDNTGQMAIDAMRETRPIYLHNWGKLLNYKPRAILYLDYTPFKEWHTGAGMAAGGVVIQGLTSQEWGGTVQVYYKRAGIDQLTYGVVLHEVDHLYQHFNGGLVSDRWIIEGDATYFEKVQDYDYLDRVRKWAASGTLPSLQNGGPTVSNRDGYDIGYAFFVWLTETYGDGVHLKFWKAIAQGSTMRDALKLVTGKDFVAMEGDFRAWLGAPNAEAPTALPTLGFSFPPTPTYEGATDATAAPQ